MENIKILEREKEPLSFEEMIVAFGFIEELFARTRHFPDKTMEENYADRLKNLPLETLQKLAEKIPDAEIIKKVLAEKKPEEIELKPAA